MAVLLSEEGGYHNRPGRAVTRPMRRYVHGTPNGRYHDPHIVRVLVVVHTDRWRIGGVGAVEDDLASAVRQDRVGQQHQIFSIISDTLAGIVKEARGIDVED